MKKMTLNEAVALVKQCDKLFDRAANAWTRGNNSGNSEANNHGNALCDKLRAEAEALLAPLGIECDYPGLYPSFKFHGFDEHSVQSAVSAALDNGQKARGK